VTPQIAVCWDVDGTLLRAGRVGGAVLRAAFAEVTGLEAPEGVVMGGLTDRLVADAYRDLLPRDAAAALHARGDEYGVAFADAVTRAWAGRDAELAAVTAPLPGVPETVAALAAEPGVTQVVVTGNVRAGAEAKLRAAGLLERGAERSRTIDTAPDGPLDLDRGAYGHLGGPRSTLVHAARAALEAHHGPPVVLVVVGDTPRDVEAAHAAGAIAVGVATGAASIDDLHASGAEHVFDDLSDPRRLVAVVRGTREDWSHTTRGGS
jgi:phosphoglycolate phosphatase-like HAD superfamily hydrolase